MAEVTRGYMRPSAKEPPASEWPRKYGEFSLPIGSFHMGSIYMPVLMTEKEWDTVFNYLEVVRRGASMEVQYPSLLLPEVPHGD